MAAFFCGDEGEGNSGNKEPNKWNYVLKFYWKIWDSNLKGDKDAKCNIYMYNHFNLDLIRNFFVHP